MGHKNTICPPLLRTFLKNELYSTAEPNQRVLNDLWRARLSRIVWFGSSPYDLAPRTPPTTLSLQHKLDRRHTGRDWERETVCWRKRVVGVGGRSRIKRPQKSLFLAMYVQMGHRDTICTLLLSIFLWNELYSMEGQAFSPSYDLAPRKPSTPHPLPLQ
jgi:hypothetical protein